MKTIAYLSILVISLALTSCEMINNLIPDVEKTESETFPIYVDKNEPSGVTDTTIIDITTTDEYKEYKDRIKGYKVKWITAEIENYNGPDDLYFSGEIICFDDQGQTVVSAGKVTEISLKDMDDKDMEEKLYDGKEGYDQIVRWLKKPGKFNIRFEYKFTDAMGVDYNFTPEEIGANFTLKLNFRLVILTGL
jgi:hypothetical protein